MVSDDLLAKVRVRMARRRVTQKELGAECGLSQPHLSKVLSNKIKLARKTKQRLSTWLKDVGATAIPTPHDTVQALITRLETTKPGRRMQIMELLRAIDRLVGR
jgi:hypothetical protein